MEVFVDLVAPRRSERKEARILGCWKWKRPSSGQRNNNNKINFQNSGYTRSNFVSDEGGRRRLKEAKGGKRRPKEETEGSRRRPKEA
jgi:hypothetical protein